MNNLANAAAINAAQPQLDALTAEGADHYDPVRFQFIHSMVQRLGQHQGASQRALQQRALAALQQYREDYALAKSAATEIVQQASTADPDSAQVLTRYLQQNQLTRITQLANKLRRSQRSNNRRAMIELTRQLYGNNPVSEIDQNNSFEQQLQQQERSASESLATAIPTTIPTTTALSGELKSIRQFRESWKKIHAQQLVENSVNQGPKDAGPLNPERLAIRSLSAIREISPDYMNHFTSYVETLLWLQQISEKNAAASRKKKKSKASN